MKSISKKIIVGTVAASLVLGSGVVGLLHTTAFANTVGKELEDNTEQQDQDQEVADDAVTKQEQADGEQDEQDNETNDDQQ
ncbi:hypothetical protein [Paenibacillus andongensis]|uniref:hypothetical protein n=1 Tax=Paenibacillus andongensis TaxID=2975482 RepID=UPI0021BA9F5D|nr:hypothetical protein [Paenibacillus andongensis]